MNIEKQILISKAYHLFNDAIRNKIMTCGEAVIYLEKIGGFFREMAIEPLEIVTKEFIKNIENDE